MQSKERKDAIEKYYKLLSDNYTKLSLKQKRNLIARIRMLMNYEKDHPTKCYEPQTHQLKFHNAANRIRFMFGGNQSGKTYSGKMEAAIHFTLNYPDWWEGHRFKKPTSGCIMVKDLPHGVGDIMQPALESVIPDTLIKSKVKSGAYPTKWIGHNKSKITIVTHDTDTKALEGAQYDWFWPDEPPPRDKWVAVQRGLIRRKGITFGTCTPLDEPWIYDEIYLNPDHFNITVSMDENEHLDEKSREFFLNMLTEDEIEARRYGRFMHLSGLVYKEFGKEHIVENLPLDLKDWPKWQVIDPHSRRPFAIIYFAVDPTDKIWIYDEWPKGNFHNMKSSGYTPEDYANIFREMEVGKTIHRRIMDGRFCKQPQGAGGDSLLEIFDKLDIHFEPSYITTKLGISDPGHMKVKEMLRLSPLDNSPGMYVYKGCHNVIYGFQHNVWDESRAQGVVKERPREYAKDFLDCIRYGLMDDPKYIVGDSYDEPSWAQDVVGSYGSSVEY